MANYILFAIIDITATGALVRFYPGVEMELEVLNERQTPIEDFVAMQTFEVELVVDGHVVLVPVLVSKRFPTLVAENRVRFFQVNCRGKSF